MLSTAGRRTLPALTGLRFVAAFAIFNVHFLPNTTLAWPPFQYLYGALQAAAGSGVCMFFALSGFILAYSNQETTLGRTDLVNFFANRVSRIYPVYLLGILWFAPFILFHRFTTEPFQQAASKAISSFTPAALLLQAWIHPRFAVAWNGPGWSLSVEAAFYLFFPYLISRIRSASAKQLQHIAIGCCLLSALMSGMVPVVLKGWTYVREFTLFNPLFHLPTFVFGAATGLYFQHAPANEFRNLPIIGMIAFLALAMITPILPVLMIHNTLFLPIFGMLFLGLARGGLGSGVLARPMMVRLGEASYALYILQFSIAMTFLALTPPLRLADYFASLGSFKSGSFVRYGLLLLTSVAVSVVVFEKVETPARHWMKALIRRRLLTEHREHEREFNPNPTDS